MSKRREPARRGDGDRLRGEIIEAARRLAAVTGDPGSLTLRGVAREVGVAATSIYLHFPRIEELLLELKRSLFAELQERVESAGAAAGDDARQRVHARARAYIDYAVEEPGLYHVLFSAPSFQDLTPRLSEADASGLLSRANTLGMDWFAMVRDEIAAIVGADQAEMVTVHFWTGLHGLVTLRTTRVNFPWPDLSVEVADLVDRLVTPRKLAKRSKAQSPLRREE